MLNKQDLIQFAVDFTEQSPDNVIGREAAVSPDMEGLRLFEAPLVRFGDAADPLFRRLKEPDAVGEHFILPREWLGSGETVLSFFLPFTERVKTGNTGDKTWPSPEWLHGRIEGQKFVSLLASHLRDELVRNGFDVVIPIQDSRFAGGATVDGVRNPFTSNWSERHVGYVCGLGTFGLSKGLITEAGIAGRMGSLVTSLKIPADERVYSGIYDYCSMCGDCVARCPVRAISPESGKNHKKCSDFLDITLEKHKPYYGCGKCQVGVSCQNRIPVL